MLKWLLKAAGIARSVYYYWCRVIARPDRYADEKRRIAAIFHQHRGRYGYRRITWTLRRQGYPLNHKTVQRLMVEPGRMSAPFFRARAWPHQATELTTDGVRAEFSQFSQII